MIFIGIDPGLSGGIAALDDDGDILLAEVMPVMFSPIAGRKMVDGRGLAATLRGTQHCVMDVPTTVNRTMLAAIEQVGAMPKQGVVGTFSFGQAYGTAIGVLGALNVPYQFVKPQVWQKANALSADKAQTLGWAQRRWPTHSFTKSKDGITDALAIADWLRGLFRS